jgi:hypothetical protein
VDGYQVSVVAEVGGEGTQKAIAIKEENVLQHPEKSSQRLGASPGLDNYDWSVAPE